MNQNAHPSKQDQATILNKVYTALGMLKIDGTQSEILSETRKGIAIVNNALVAEVNAGENISSAPEPVVESA